MDQTKIRLSTKAGKAGKIIDENNSIVTELGVINETYSTKHLPTTSDLFVI